MRAFVGSRLTRGASLAAVLSVVLLVVAASAASAATRYVATTGTDAGGNICTVAATPCKTINRAITVSAATGDVINVAAGTYPEAVVISNKEVTINGAGQTQTIINPGGTSAAQKIALNISPGNGKVVTISGIKATGGYQTSFTGGVALSSGELRLSDSTISGNVGGLGGGVGLYTNLVANAAPKLTANNVTISANTSVAIGGGIFSSGTVTLTNSTVDGNVAAQTAPPANNPITNAGGGIFTFKTLATDTPSVSLDHTTISNNKAYNGGGVAVLTGATLTATNGSSFTANTAARNGGGVHDSGAATLSGATMSQNTAGSEGGSLYAGTFTSAADTPVATLTNTDVSGSTAALAGGGIAAENKATLHVSGGSIGTSTSLFGGGLLVNTGATGDLSGGVKLTKNQTSSGGYGGGLYDMGTLTLDTVTLDQNKAVPTSANAGGLGGGFYLASATPLGATHVTSTSNSAFSGGSGVVGSGATLTASDLSSTGDTATANGGALYVAGTATVRGSSLKTSRAGFEGGAIFAGIITGSDHPVLTLDTTSIGGAGGLIGGGLTVENQATAHVTGGDFTSNTSLAGGGLLVNAGGTADVSGGTDFTSNQAPGGSGGGIWSAGAVTLSGAHFTSNVASINGSNQNGLGGGLYVAAGTTGASNVSFSQNVGTIGGGAAVAAPATLHIADSTFSHDTGTIYGGGLFTSGAVTVDNTPFSTETAGFLGGAVAAIQTASTDTPVLTLADSPITAPTSNAYGGGAAVGAKAALHMTGAGITGGTAVTGGALYVQEGGSADLHRADLEQNKANGGDGGAVANAGTFTSEDSEISANTVTPTSGNNATGFGAAIYSGSTTAPTGVKTTLDRVTVAGNQGVGATILGSNATAIHDSTVADNTSSGVYGAITTNGALTVRGSTVHGNSAAGANNVGGIVAANGTAVVAGSIVASNGPRSCAGVTDGGYNLGDAADTSCGFSAANHDIKADAKLGSLADNGGPTRTKAPTASSPAINKIPVGTTSVTDPVDGGAIALCVSGAVDQRGMARPQGPSCDIGSVEVAVSAATIDGPTSARMITGQAASLSYTSTGVPTPSFSVTGTLPAGTALQDAGDGTATISGTPAAGSAGTYHVTVSATNGVGDPATKDLTILVVDPVKVTTASLPNGVLGAPYSAQLQAGGGVPPYHWTLASGSLPNGLSLADDGTISGTPQGTAGTATFTVKVVDSEAGALQLSDTKQLSITVTRTPTVLTAEPALIKLGPGLLKVTLIDLQATLKTDAGAPVAGQTITFSAGGTTVCTATTNSAGLAVCHNATLTALLPTLLGLGYDAKFAGNASLEPASAHAGLIG